MATLFNTKIKDTYQSLLKLEDNTILTTTSKNITDGLGNASPLYLSTTQVRIGSNSASAMYWDNTNNRLGIGTSSPTQPLSVNGQILSINGRVSTGTTWIDYDGTFNSAWGWLRISSAGNIRLLNSTVIGADIVPTATLHVKGAGSTSATTSLLVTNSGGVDRFRVYDDGTVFIGNTNPGIYTTFGYSGRIGNNLFESPSAIYRYGGGQLTFYGTNNNANAFSFEHSNQQASTSTGISMINLGGTYQNQNDFQFSNLRIAPEYNFNASTTTLAVARGIYYNPTITNLRVAQHRAIETVTGDVLFGTTSGKATFGSGVAGTSYIEIKPGISNGNNRITFNDFDGGTFTRGGFLELGTYGAKLQFGRYNQFGLGCDLYPYTLSAISNTGEQSVIISSGDTALVGNGSRLQVYGTTFIKGNGSTSATTSLLVQNSSGTQLGVVNDAGQWMIGTGTPLFQLDVANDIRARGGVYFGSAGSYLYGDTNNIRLYDKNNTTILQAFPSGVVSSETYLASSSGNKFVRINDNAISLEWFNGNASNGVQKPINVLRGFFGNVLATDKTVLNITTPFSSNLTNATTLRGIFIDINDTTTYTGFATVRAIEAPRGGAYFNTTTPQASAVLQADSTTQGFLPPRVTTIQKNAISSPATGLMVFDTDLVRPCFFNGATWITL